MPPPHAPPQALALTSKAQLQVPPSAAGPPGFPREAAWPRQRLGALPEVLRWPVR